MAKGIINPMELKKHSKLEEGRFNLASKNKLANDSIYDWVDFNDTVKAR